tara:strand:+ start:43 stop:579 length:537 start_codon:yes stop_codon:yes gene_type:complete
MKNLFKALSQFQQEVPVIHQNTKGYNYTYADLKIVFDVIKPLLKKHGLGFTQYLSGDDLATILFHTESGERLDSFVTIPKVQLKGQNEFQALGSGITYLRRYSLSCLLCLITDKDADAAEEPTELKQKVKLTEQGYQFLISDKATVKDLETALKEREISQLDRSDLDEVLQKLKDGNN